MIFIDFYRGSLSVYAPLGYRNPLFEQPQKFVEEKILNPQIIRDAFLDYFTINFTFLLLI